MDKEREEIAREGQLKFGYVDWDVELPITKERWYQLADFAISLIHQHMKKQPIEAKIVGHRQRPPMELPLDFYEPKPIEIEMCKHYDPLHTYRCHQGLRGNLKCHSRRQDCKLYEPSTAKLPDIEAVKEILDNYSKRSTGLYIKHGNYAQDELKQADEDLKERIATKICQLFPGLAEKFDLALIDKRFCSSLKWVREYAKVDMPCSYWDCSRGIKAKESYYFQDFDSELDGQEIYCIECASFFMSQRLSGIIPLAALKETHEEKDRQS